MIRVKTNFSKLGNFSHFVCDFMFQLYLVMNTTNHLEGAVNIYASETVPERLFNFLKACFPEVKFKWKVEACLGPCIEINKVRFNPDMFVQEREFFRGHVLKSLGKLKNDYIPSYVVVINRKKQNIRPGIDRWLENQEELNEAVKVWAEENKKLVYYVTLEDIPIESAVEIISNCEVLIGQHGAGMANLIWLPSNARVIEIGFKFPKDRPADIFEILCRRFGINHSKSFPKDRMYADVDDVVRLLSES